MQFCDNSRLKVKAGNGGNGIVAWRREAHYPEGGPYGGDGGNGGDVIIIGDHNINSLFHLRYLKQISAENGENGQSKLCSGKSGENKYIKVPLGTSIYDANTNELLVDILKDGQEFIVCYGGKGGYGNAHFKSSINKAPTLFENGDLGEEKEISLKLKYIADIGIIGLPNAGKSSLISAISSAKPKIDNYQFTTIYPVLGTVNINNEKIIFADIPGLIEGASSGKGLGHEFLKHIERCNLLIHLISMDKSDNDDVIKAYETINDELKKYHPVLMSKKIIIVANKSDVDGSELNHKILEKYLKTKILFVSAKYKTNLEQLLDECWKSFNENKINTKKDDDVEIIELKKKKNIEIDFNIEQIDDHIWKVNSKWLDYWSQKIPLTTSDNLIRFNQKMETLDVENKAKSLGAKPGDTLLVGNNELIIDK